MAGLGDLLADAKAFVVSAMTAVPRGTFCTNWVSHTYCAGYAYGIPDGSWPGVADTFMAWIKSQSGGVQPDAPWKNSILAVFSTYKTMEPSDKPSRKTYVTLAAYASPSTAFAGAMAGLLASLVTTLQQRTANRRAEVSALVVRLFTELLGRTVAGSELDAWINRVIGENLTESQIRMIIADSQEYKDHQVQQQQQQQQQQQAQQQQATEEAKKFFAAGIGGEFLKSPILWVGIASAGILYYWTQVKNKSMAQIPYVGQYLGGSKGRKKR